jgi:hypothetical protein
MSESKYKYATQMTLVEIADKLEARLSNIGALIHYPEHWDTACYETLEDALHEIGCSECRK